jgi:hypothetical protein
MNGNKLKRDPSRRFLSQFTAKRRDGYAVTHLMAA